MEAKEKILIKSEDLFLKYGLRSVSMDDISNKLGMSKKTLYNYFDNKRDLVNNVILNFITREKEFTNDILDKSLDSIDEVLSIARHILEFLRKVKPTALYDLQKYYPNSWELIQTLHMSHIEETIKNNINKGIKEGLYRKNLDATIISKLYVAKTMILNDESFFPYTQFNKESVFIEFIKYHLHGIVSQAGFEKLEKIKSI